MDLTRLFTVLCAFLLIIGLSLILAVTVVLQRTVALEEEKGATEALSDSHVSDTSRPAETDTASDFTETEDDPTVDADVLYSPLCIREAGGRIGVYSEEGYLIRMIDVAVATLPLADQRALKTGIHVSSWKELLSLIQDYE